MAKNKMQIKYKTQKRVRNKDKKEETTEDTIKSFGYTLLGVFIFMGVCYLIVLGMKSLGVFDAGYTAPVKENTEFDYEFIPIGTVFNRSDKNYYVLFDNYENDFTSDVYINSLVEDETIPVYKVDMSKKENSKYKSDTANNKAKNVNELKINDITLIKITNGKISSYIIGRESIEEYLNK